MFSNYIQHACYIVYFIYFVYILYIKGIILLKLPSQFRQLFPESQFTVLLLTLSSYDQLQT